MSWTAIFIAMGLIAVIFGVAYWFADQDYKANPTGRVVDLDPQEAQKLREQSSSLLNVGGGSGPSLL